MYKLIFRGVFVPAFPYANAGLYEGLKSTFFLQLFMGIWVISDCLKCDTLQFIFSSYCKVFEH